MRRLHACCPGRIHELLYLKIIIYTCMCTVDAKVDGDDNVSKKKARPRCKNQEEHDDGREEIGWMESPLSSVRWWCFRRYTRRAGSSWEYWRVIVARHVYRKWRRQVDVRYDDNACHRRRPSWAVGSLRVVVLSVAQSASVQDDGDDEDERQKDGEAWERQRESDRSRCVCFFRQPCTNLQLT